VSPRQLALIPSAVALNAAAGWVVKSLGLPIYLDTIGTVLAAALAGPWVGVVTGVVGQVVFALSTGDMMWLPFAVVQVIIALLAALAARRGGFRSLGVSAAWGALVGLAAGAASAVISYAVFRGVTATGVTAVTTLLSGLGLTLAQSVTLASVGTDLVDKLLVLVLVGVALRSLPRRVAARFPWAQRAVAR
jgi:energy-coupling factor transport system substrate-specific component